MAAFANLSFELDTGAAGVPDGWTIASSVAVYRYADFSDAGTAPWDGFEGWVGALKTRFTGLGTDLTADTFQTSAETPQFVENFATFWVTGNATYQTSISPSLYSFNTGFERADSAEDFAIGWFGSGAYFLDFNVDATGASLNPAYFGYGYVLFNGNTVFENTAGEAFTFWFGNNAYKFFFVGGTGITDLTPAHFSGDNYNAEDFETTWSLMTTI